MNVKIGDKVRAIVDSPSSNPFLRKGATGKVVGIYISGSPPVCVLWNNFNKGHSGINNDMNNMYSHWCVCETEIELCNIQMEFDFEV